MDPFAQRMLEKAEQRSRALGISNASNFASNEYSSDASITEGYNSAIVTSQQQPKLQQKQQLQYRTPALTQKANTGSKNQVQVIEKPPMELSENNGKSTGRVLRQFAALDKENMDLGIEINIMSDKQIEVQVEVQDCNTTDDEDTKRSQIQSVNEPLARIRDTSRNRLQRLGALYSNTDNLSSPIHRTEAQFHADDVDNTEHEANAKRPKQRYGKLVALANSINQWEDDTAHSTSHSTTTITTTAESSTTMPPPKPELPSRRLTEENRKKPNTTKSRAPQPPVAAAPTSSNNQQLKAINKETKKNTDGMKTDRNKKLNWDPKVINSLEAQGFQRRESSSVKYAYDYTKEANAKSEEVIPTIDKATLDNKTADHPKTQVVSKIASTFNTAAQNVENNKPSFAEKNVTSFKSGLVSGRAAVFEQKAAQQEQQRPQKDPTELSLKERMKLFERNKGEALLPKAAFAMAPSINQIRQENSAREKRNDEIKAATNASSKAATKTIPDGNKVRDKVAALVANAATMSENKIRNDIQKQRQEEMQLLSSRFNKQKELFHNSSNKDAAEAQPKATTNTQQSQIKAKVAALTAVNCAARPPPPPPPPPAIESPVNSSKRRSPATMSCNEDESKRARKSSNMTTANKLNPRLYPALSDLESNTSEADNCCTTVSARSTGDELDQHQVDDDESCMYTDDDDDGDGNGKCNGLRNRNLPDDGDAGEDSSVDICNGSLGREIMQVVQNNEHQQKQHKVKQIKEVHYSDKNYYFGGDTEGGDSSLNSSAASCGVTDCLDEALDDDDGDDDYTQESADDDVEYGDENTSRASVGSKGTTTSNSFSFRKTAGGKYNNCHTISEEQQASSHSDDDDDEAVGYQTTNAHKTHGIVSGFAQPVKSELKVNEENDNMVTLVHTVSFYRRQQNSANSTPVRRVCREQQLVRNALHSAAAKLQFDQQTPNAATSGYATQEMCTDEVDSNDFDETASDTDLDESELVQDKIKKLLDEVCKQQQVIGQTSQALNLCAATIEFSGSTESVEGERHLLVATHRRQCCLDEVQRLRVEKSLRPLGAPKEKGRLTVKEITVPLRQDYIRKLAADTISGHHLVCLLKYNEHVLATKTVPTLPGLLAVKFPDVLQLDNVHADFKITLEIYGMTAQREVLPHDVKYHINLNKKSGIKTPKKKGQDNRLVRPPVQSPAGPHVVRTPALVQYGFAIFSLREIQRTTWSLTQVLGVSPLDGVVHMKVNCELSVSVEYKGFLTMFEDVSGFGAWHRRWCYLNGTMLNYWKYPDDEKKKTPMGSIDLYTCTSQKVTLAPRDICARLHTMLLECQRPAQDTDHESLIIVPNGRTTTVRHLLSADTKEEREEWCAYFNKALTLLRAWGPPQ